MCVAIEAPGRFGSLTPSPTSQEPSGAWITSRGNWSGCGGVPGVFAREAVEHGEHGDGVLGCGGGVGADGGEVLGAVEGAHASGDSLSDLGHLSFGRVVVERYGRVGGESSDVSTTTYDSPPPRPYRSTTTRPNDKWPRSDKESPDACAPSTAPRTSPPSAPTPPPQPSTPSPCSPCST